MILVPYSTEIHDGRIRIAALEIIGLCLLIHIFVYFDTQRVQRDLNAEVQRWEMERAADTTRTFSDAIADMEYLLRTDPEGIVGNQAREILEGMRQR